MRKNTGKAIAYSGKTIQAMLDKTHLKKAVAEGRVCKHCGWMVNKKRWKQGKRYCANCEEALRGVRAGMGHGPYLDEPLDKAEAW